MWEIGLVLGVLYLVALWALLGANGDAGDNDTDDIGLGEDAGPPAPVDLRAARRARPVAASRDRQAVATLRVRARIHGVADRAERRRIERWLLGTPHAEDPLDLDALTAAADRLKQSAQRCSPKDAA
jgi:hypothetical protein